MRFLSLFNRRNIAKRRQRNRTISAGGQALEDRTLLSCDVRLLDDGTLQIRGDETDNHVRISDHGGGRVSVACGDADGRFVEVETPIFESVIRIHTQMFEGNDTVEVRAGLRSDGELVQAVSEQIHELGKGNDLISAKMGSLLVGPAGHRMTIDDGPGIDVVRVHVSDTTIDEGGKFVLTGIEHFASEPVFETSVVGARLANDESAESPGISIRGNDDSEKIDLRLSPGTRAGHAHGHLDYLKQVGDPATDDSIVITFRAISWQLNDDGLAAADIQTFGGADDVAVEALNLENLALKVESGQSDSGDRNNIKQIGIAIHAHADQLDPARVTHLRVAAAADRFDVESSNFERSELIGTIDDGTDAGPDPVVRHALEMKLENAVIGDWRQEMSLVQSPGGLPAVDVATNIATPAEYVLEFDAENIPKVQFANRAPDEQFDVALTAGASADVTVAFLFVSDIDDTSDVDFEAANYRDVQFHLKAPDEQFDAAMTAGGFGTPLDSRMSLTTGPNGLRAEADGFNDVNMTYESRDTAAVEEPEKISLTEASYDDKPTSHVEFEAGPDGFQVESANVHEARIAAELNGKDDGERSTFDTTMTVEGDDPAPFTTLGFALGVNQRDYRLNLDLATPVDYEVELEAENFASLQFEFDAPGEQIDVAAASSASADGANPKARVHASRILDGTTNTIFIGEALGNVGIDAAAGFAHETLDVDLAAGGFGTPLDTSMSLTTGPNGLRAEADGFNELELTYESRDPSALLAVEEPEKISLTDASFDDKPTSHVEFEVGPDGFQVESANFHEARIAAELNGENKGERSTFDTTMTVEGEDPAPFTTLGFQLGVNQRDYRLNLDLATPVDYEVELEAENVPNLRFELDAPDRRVFSDLKHGQIVGDAFPRAAFNTSAPAEDGTINIAVWAELYEIAVFDIESTAGDDIVQVHAAAPIAQSGTPFDAEFTGQRREDDPPTRFESSFILGDGNDMLDVEVQGFNEQQFLLNAGAGDDDVRYSSPAVEEPEKISLGDASFDSDLGPGDDRFELVLDWTPPDEFNRTIAGEIDVNVRGGHGDDAIFIDVWGDSLAGASTTYRGPINLTLDGGGGANDVAIAQFQEISGISIDQQPIDDLLGSSITVISFERSRISFDNVDLDRSLSWIVQIAPGDDAAHPMWHRTVLRDVHIAGRFEQNIQGTPGNDDIRLRLDGVVIESGGQLLAEVHGRAGNDRIVYNHAGFIAILPFAEVDVQFFGGDGTDIIIGRGTATIGGEYSFTASGGRGRDVLVCNFRLDIDGLESSDPPAVSVLLKGGAGNDALFLTADVDDDLDPFFAAVLDGGDGFDFCEVNGDARVRVINCEAGGGD